MCCNRYKKFPALSELFAHNPGIGNIRNNRRFEHMGTMVVLAVLILAVVLVIRSMIRDKKNGKSLQCGGGCKYCGGHCHQTGSGIGGE